MISRGSEWRIWDLHIHSPASGIGTESDYPAFIKNLNESEADVIGINDYSTIDGYEKILENGGIDGKVIFPVMELRMVNKLNHKNTSATDGGVSINFHLIFDNTLTVRQINTELSALTCFHEGGEKVKLGHVDPKDYQGIMFDYFETIDALENSTVTNGRFLTWVPYDEYGGIDNIDPLNDSFFKLGIIQKAKVLGSSNKKQIEWFLSDNCFKDTGKRIPCIKGSDSHEINYPFGRLRDKDSKPIEKFCWIKGDPTFEGLRQIVYEPKQRVRIQSTNPDFNFDKPVFESFEITRETKIIDSDGSKLSFESGKIPLNRNLVAIIGGRGKGKSMLVNFISNALNKEVSIKLRDKLLLNKNFKVLWKQTNDSTIKEFTLETKQDLPFTFIYQSKIKEIADDQQKLKDEVLDILKGAGYKKPSDRYDEISVKETFQSYWNLREWLNKKDDNDNPVNSIDFAEKRIETVRGNIKIATDRESKDLLDTYIKNLTEIEEINSDIQELNEFKEEIEEFQLTISSHLEKFEVTPFDFNVQVEEIAKLLDDKATNIKALQAENSRIKEENFKDFKGDLSQLLSNLESYRAEINSLERHIGNIQSKEVELSEIKKELDLILKSYYEDLLLEAKSINDTWEHHIFNDPSRGKEENDLIRNILDKRDIKIESEIFFNKSQFISDASNYIDGRVVKSKHNKIPELLELSDNTAQDVLEYTIEKVERIKGNNETIFWDGIENDIANVFLNKATRDKYIKVRPKITVAGDELDYLSAGQKGTIYLCLKLATQTFSGPLIFDQPEDDLDNEFINEELIQLFTEIKEFRQVIIVSHNANLVVNADSEQIVIANNDHGKLSYNSGSLENDQINQGICRILEGGQIAFENRRNRYQFPR